MKRKVKFAVMQYIPNFERNERINVAVILHSPSDEYMKIKVIENFKRLKEFDDELDMNFIKAYFKSVEESFTYTPFKANDIDITNVNLLDKITSFYVGLFVFYVYDNISIDCDCDMYLEEIKNNFLYYDNIKKKRISQKESTVFFSNLLNSKNIKYEVMGNKNCLLGNFEEKINVDFKIENKYYKIINFTNSNIDTYTPTIKMWMMNAIELKEKNEEIIFVINEQIVDSKTEIFVNMLSKYGKVIKISDFIKTI